jgi:pimeloyl-ACP methyl ester carboxylesterase
MPTVVLVHGAFADGSSWNGVIEELQKRDLQVIAPANPLRGIAHDSGYLAGVLEEIQGPVVTVGHSYGGAVITNAAARAKNVAALVFVAAFAPEEGERLGEATQTSKDALLGPALVTHQHQGPNGGEPMVEFSVDPGQFHTVFAADLPAEQAAVMAATQRPVAEAAFSEPNGKPAWKHVPSWAVIATQDKAAGADLVRSMAERASATTTELEGSHVIMVSQPEAVAEVIFQAIAVSSSHGDQSWAEAVYEAFITE